MCFGGRGKVFFFKMFIIVFWRWKFIVIFININRNKMLCVKVIGLCSNKLGKKVLGDLKW